MDLQKFKETYKQVITESADNSELKNYIRSIVVESIEEHVFESLIFETFKELEEGVDNADSFDKIKKTLERRKFINDPKDSKKWEHKNGMIFELGKPNKQGIVKWSFSYKSRSFNGSDTVEELNKRLRGNMILTKRR